MECRFSLVSGLATRGRSPEQGLEVIAGKCKLFWHADHQGQGLPGNERTGKVVSRIREVNLPPYKALRLKWIR